MLIKLTMIGLLCCSLLFSCEDHQAGKVITKRENGQKITGFQNCNGAFEGIVKYYDGVSDALVKTVSFKNGIENGPAKQYNNGVMTDSAFYVNGFKKGFGFKFSDGGKVIYKSFFYHDRNIGDRYEYDSLGNFRHFYFFDFEGNIIYQEKYEAGVFLRNGELLNVKANDGLIAGEKKLFYCFILYILQVQKLTMS